MSRNSCVPVGIWWRLRSYRSGRSLPNLDILADMVSSHWLTGPVICTVLVALMTGAAAEDRPRFSEPPDATTLVEVSLPDERDDAHIPTVAGGKTPPADELGELRRRIEQLEAERAAEKSRASAKVTADDPMKRVDAGAKGSEKNDGEKKEGAGAQKPPEDWLDLSTEKWDVKLGGHVQMDFVTWANADPAIQGDQNYFEFRRLRLAADGKGYGVYDFRLQMTLEPESIAEQTSATPEVKDAYFSINEIPLLGRWRIGNFFGHSRWNR